MATEPVAAPRGRLHVSTRLGGWPLLVSGAVLLVLAVRIWVAFKIATPWIFLDELLYGELAKSIASGGHLWVRGVPADIPSVLYPAAIAPAWLLNDVGTAYQFAKAINVVLMTAACIPTYFWARRLVPPVWAATAVGLVLVMPSMLYTGVLMSENAFFPLFVAATFAMAAALERPTLWRQALVFAPVLLAIGVRVQAIVLLAVLPAAIVVKAAFDALAAARPRWRAFVASVRAFWATFAVLVVGGLAFVLYEHARGRTVTSALGSYSDVTSASYSFSDVRHWIGLHFAELAFSVGIVPACAVILLVGLALLGRPTTAAERSFLAVASTAVVLVVVQVAIFASRFSFRIEERYMFPLAPLLFIALVLWIARGAERPRVLTAISVAVPLLLVTRLQPRSAPRPADPLGHRSRLIPVWRAAQLLNGGADAAQNLLFAGAVVAAAAFAFVPRRFAAVLPLAVGAFLAIGSYPVYGAIRDYALALETYAGGPDRDWIDDAVPGHVDTPYLYDAARVPGYDDMLLWQTEFWNRDVGEVVRLGPTVRDSLPEDTGSIDPVTGRITVPSLKAPKYVVTTAGADRRRHSARQEVDPDALPRCGAAPDRERGGRPLRRRLVGADGGVRAVRPQRARRIAVTLSREAWGGQDVPGTWSSAWGSGSQRGRDACDRTGHRRAAPRPASARPQGGHAAGPARPVPGRGRRDADLLAVPVRSRRHAPARGAGWLRPQVSRVGDRIRDPSADLLGALFAGGLILGAIAVRWAWADGVKAPQILCDEFFYSGIARSLEQGEGFTFRGVPLAFSYVYPLMIAPAWALSPMERTYEAAKAVNVVAMSLTAVPVYLWARRLVSPAWSVLACFLVLLMPAFAFTGLDHDGERGPPDIRAGRVRSCVRARAADADSPGARACGPRTRVRDALPERRSAAGIRRRRSPRAPLRVASRHGPARAATPGIAPCAPGGGDGACRRRLPGVQAGANRTLRDGARSV